jgi:hypothetical protein
LRDITDLDVYLFPLGQKSDKTSVLDLKSPFVVIIAERLPSIVARNARGHRGVAGDTS